MKNYEYIFRSQAKCGRGRRTGLLDCFALVVYGIFIVVIHNRIMHKAVYVINNAPPGRFECI